MILNKEILTVNSNNRNHDAENLQKNISVMDAFINGKMTALDFEEKFLKLHRHDTHSYANDAHKIISIMFSDIDSFCSNPEIRDENDIDEKELRDRTSKALINLSR